MADEKKEEPHRVTVMQAMNIVVFCGFSGIAALQGTGGGFIPPDEGGFLALEDLEGLYRQEGLGGFFILE